MVVNPRSSALVALLLLGFAGSGAVAAAGDAERLASVYADSVRSLNEAHAAKPGKETETELGKRLPKEAARALDELLKAKDSLTGKYLRAR